MHITSKQIFNFIMIKFINKNNKRTPNRRRFIDIYFILYLTALVILISDKDKSIENHPVSTSLPNIEFPFRIKAEKPLLICKLIVDDKGDQQILIDSINYILDYGEVKDVQYEFVVEDAEQRLRLNLNNNNSSTNTFFSYTHNPSNRIAIFEWFPNINDLSNYLNKSFNVYVTASALPIKELESNSDNLDIASQRMLAKTQFSLIISDDRYSITDIYQNIVTNDSILSQSPIITQSAPPTHTILLTSTEFSLKPQTQSIRGIAGDT